jgi:hypothetical protein
MNYKTFCDQIYMTWRTSPNQFTDFSKDFDISHLPEPYYPIKKGRNPLIVLNNNPGGVLLFQEHSSILKEFPATVSYSDISDWLKDKYTNDDTIINGTAKTRISRIIQIEKIIDCDGIENVEAFFLHSNSFNKTQFLKNHLKNEITKKYAALLKNYLIDKSVLIVSAISSRNSPNLKEISNNSWLKHQAEIAGLCFDTASFHEITVKNKKITSCLIANNNKFLICTMGSNTIPKNTYSIIEQIHTKSQT